MQTWRRIVCLALVLIASVWADASLQGVAAQDKKKPEKKGKLIRARDMIEFRNHFKQLGLAYLSYVAEHNKAPMKKADLVPYLQGYKKVTDMLDNGDIVFFYGVTPQQMTKGTSNTVLAHESYEDVNGRRIVVMGDGSVHALSAADFAKTARAKN